MQSIQDFTGGNMTELNLHNFAHNPSSGIYCVRKFVK